MTKKRIPFICMALTIALSFFGCARGGAAMIESAAVPTATPAAERGEEWTVCVTSIDGRTVTAIAGELTTAQPADASKIPGAELSPESAPNAAPEKPGGNPPAGAPDNGIPPSERPSGGGTQAPNQSFDTAPTDRQGAQPFQKPDGVIFAAGTETVTFTVDEKTLIQSDAEPTSPASVEDIAAGAVLRVALDENGHATNLEILNPEPSEQGRPDGSDAPAEGAAATVIAEPVTVAGQAYASVNDDETALRIDGVAVSLSGITVNKSDGNSSNTENGDFYGVNAGLLAKNGATVTIADATVNTSAVNGNGVFACGKDTSVTISDSIIRTTERNSGGIQTTGGAQMNATNLDIETQGASSAAIRSDRGGGIVTVDGGSYATFGTGSPAIYSTADITVKNAALSANNSEAVVVEGKNSVALENCVASGNMTGLSPNEGSENIRNIMLYQSMSGDAAPGKAGFSAVGGSILAGSGDMFYVTNTACEIVLSGVELSLANGVLLNVTGNDGARGWGTSGSNGGQCAFTAAGQVLTGDVTVDDISTLEFSILDKSSFSGAINAGGDAGKVSVTLDETSVWTLTGDSYVTSFTGDISSVAFNGHTLYVGGEAIAQ